jgi:hypothetical protein
MGAPPGKRCSMTITDEKTSRHCAEKLVRGGAERDLQKRERQVAMDAGLELDFDVEVQLQAQLQAVLLH